MSRDPSTHIAAPRPPSLQSGLSTKEGAATIDSERLKIQTGPTISLDHQVWVRLNSEAAEFNVTARFPNKGHFSESFSLNDTRFYFDQKIRLDEFGKEGRLVVQRKPGEIPQCSIFDSQGKEIVNIGFFRPGVGPWEASVRSSEPIVVR